MSATRLREANLPSLAHRVARPSYDRAAQRVGIVHFGIGAFHRAHQAVYTDEAMAAGERNWAITGVSLRSADVRDRLQPQDGLYTLSQRDASGERLRIVGSVRKVLVAPQEPEAVIEALCAPEVRIVTFTVTEKGYWRDSSSRALLTGAPDVAHDLQGGGAPRTIYGFMERAFARRVARGLPGLTLVSCDNLADNGRQLEALLGEFLERRDPSLAAWARNETSCPSTMVDRIVPATTDADLERIGKTLGLDDRAAVVTEPFHQWVIEDRFVGPRPRWEIAGAQLVPHVRPFEMAKLRMLNGSHSALAYVGIQLGHDYVHQAIADPDLRALVRELMVSEAAASLRPAAGQDLAAYAASLIARFENPSLAHRLSQIAMDGTQKIPQRWLATIAALQEQGSAAPALLFALAAWIAYACLSTRTPDDPLAQQLADIRERVRGDIGAAVAAIAGPGGLFNRTWGADPASTRCIAAYVSSMLRKGMREALRERNAKH